MADLINRADKVAFWGIPASDSSGTPTYTRMHYFTEMSGSKNPKEYARQYIDETSERTDVTGYSPAWSFSFDEYSNDPMLKDIVGILDKELLGTNAQRDIIFVNFSKTASEGGYEAVKQRFAVIGDSEGGSTDAYTYSGNLKAVGAKTWGTATIASPASGTSETAETITFTEA